MKRKSKNRRPSAPEVRYRTEGAKEQRRSILRAAAGMASEQGLESLTWGALATVEAMSRSGIHAHFGSKPALQMATVAEARRIFEREVADPANAEPRGVQRLGALAGYWLGHMENRVFAGGCFFTAAAFEFDHRRGTVREAIVEHFQWWLGLLQAEATFAQENGQIAPTVDPVQLAFEIHGMLLSAHLGLWLLEDAEAPRRARTGIVERLAVVAL